MADRYLIGTGNRNWNDPLNWSETSGGAGGASVPTSPDNVIFDSNSGTGIITINSEANCLDFTCSGINPLTLSNSVYNFNVYGSLFIDPNLTVSFTGTGYLQMRATDARTITSNGNTSSWNRLYFNGIGGTWTNQDDWTTIATAIYMIYGTWNCGNNSITVYAIMTSAASNSTLNLNSSYFKVRQIYIEQGSLVLNSGTSTLDNSNSYDYFRAKESLTFYNVITDTRVLYGRYSTYQNLTILGREGSPNSSITSIYDITVLGDFKVIGSDGKRIMIIPTLYYIFYQSKIEVYGRLLLEYVDFRGLIGAGSVNWDLSAIPGGSGDCGGNLGIIFTPAQPQYFKHTSGACNWSDPTKWFSNQERTISGRVPLPQDDVTFDTDSFTGASTMTVNVPRIGRSLDMSGVSHMVTMALANTIECCGSFILGENITLTGSYGISLYGKGNFFLNTFNIPVFSITLTNLSGGYTNLSDITITRIDNSSLNVVRGTFDINDFNVIIGGALKLNSGGEVFMGNGTLEKVFNANNDSHRILEISGGVFYCEGSTIKISPVDGDKRCALETTIPLTLNKVWVSGNHTGNFDINGNNTIAELVIDPGRKVRITGGVTQNIGKITAKGTATNRITLTSTTTTPSTINNTLQGKVQADYLNLSYTKVLPENTWYAGINSVDGGNNTGWIFGDFAPVEVNAMDEGESITSEMLADGLISPQLHEIEDAEAIVCGDSVLSFDAAEHEDATSQLIGKGIVQPEYTEVEIMESDLKASSFTSFEASEDEQMGDSAGTLRAFEKIFHGSEFQAIIKSESKLL